MTVSVSVRSSIETTVQISPLKQSQSLSGATLTWENVVYDVETKTGKRTILNGVSGIAKPGQVVAIMGPTGGGKTTLLDILACKIKPSSGAVSINGEPISVLRESMADIVGRVSQQDFLFPTLTVMESISIAADLRLGSSVPPSTKQARVASIIRELGLEKVKGSLIGGEGVRGISGGEMKRTSIGTELVHSPQLLFLDEPTSGLDSATAFQVIKMLRSLARNGRTVVLTIHQPRANVFLQFDSVMLLAEGKTAYFGPPRSAVAYFGNMGYACPPLCNPADFLLDLLCPINNEDASKSVEAADPVPVDSAAVLVVGGLDEDAPKPDLLTVTNAYTSCGASVELMKQLEQASAAGVGAYSLPKIEKKDSNCLTSLLREFFILTGRSWLVNIRQPLVTFATLGQNIVTAILIGVLYFHQSKSQDSVRNREGACFFITTNLFFSNLKSLRLFIAEKNIVAHERGNRMYGTFPYFLGKTIAELPFSILFPIVFSAIAYWMMSFQARADKFFLFIVAIIATGQSAEGIVLCVGSVASSEPVAMIFAPLFLMLFLLFGGYFVAVNSIVVWLQWIKVISPFKYGYAALALNEFDGLGDFVCPGGASNCPIPDAKAAIDQLGLGRLTYWENIIVLLSMSAAYRIIALLVLMRKYR